MTGVAARELILASASGARPFFFFERAYAYCQNIPLTAAFCRVVVGKAHLFNTSGLDLFIQRSFLDVTADRAVKYHRLR